MPKRSEKSSPRRRPAALATAPAPIDGRWLSALAMAIAAAVVIARVGMTETTREVSFVAPGSTFVPAGPGPASGLVLDLLACLCPMLVLARRWIDPEFRLRRSISPIIFLLLGAWAVASTLWASDRFSAIVSSFHLLSAAVMLWAVSQCVSSWRHLWLVAAFGAAVLAMLLVHGIWYHFIDRPALIEQFHQDPSLVLKSQNVQPGTFQYQQMVNSIEHGELRGFSSSPNSYAAQLVLLGLIALAACAAYLRRRQWVSAGVAGTLILADLLVLPLTQSRGGFATGALGTLLLIMLLVFTWPRDTGVRSLSELLRRRATLLYIAGLTAVLAVAAFIIGYGFSRGTLFQDSLNFRWRYWTASLELWKRHLNVGVGWENFGNPYLAVRSPEAVEEIKDPHNFLVRFATELGLIGLLLTLAWVARAWWELSRPVLPPADEPDPERQPREVGGRSFLLLAAPLVVGLVLNLFCSVDFNGGVSFVVLETIRRVVFLVAMVLAGGAIAGRIVRVESNQFAYQREVSPAPELLAGLLVGLGMFFIHSLVDFAMFELGPMFLLAALLGAAIGLRTPAAPETPDATDARSRAIHGRKRARLALAISGGAWLLAAVLLVVPVISAEADAREGDDLLRRSKGEDRISGERVEAAAHRYEAAFHETIANASYASRAGLAWNLISVQDRARKWLDVAVAADPASPANYARRAEFLAQSQPPDFPGAVRDMTESVSRDPINRLDRLRLATFLEQAGRSDEALTQILHAIELNERLTKEETRRFTPDQFREVPQAIVRLVIRRIFG
jgi:O-antigen ligase